VIFNMTLETPDPLYQEQRPKESFKHWLIREYSDSRLMYHPSWELAMEIQTRWPNFPEKGNYLELGLFLANNGACNRCKKAFRDAWQNYINDG